MRIQFVVLVYVLFLTGCETSEVVTGEPIPLGTPFTVPASVYSLSHYFVDTSYISRHEDFYLSDPPLIKAAGLQIIRMEVWVQIPESIHDARTRRCNAILGLSARGSGYDSTLRSSANMPGIIETWQFLLITGDSYGLMGFGYTGILTMNMFDPAMWYGPTYNDESIVAVA